MKCEKCGENLHEEEMVYRVCRNCMIGDVSGNKSNAIVSRISKHYYFAGVSILCVLFFYFPFIIYMVTSYTSNFLGQLFSIGFYWFFFFAWPILIIYAIAFIVKAFKNEEQNKNMIFSVLITVVCYLLVIIGASNGLAISPA
jgi:hypothetical protein